MEQAVYKKGIFTLDIQYSRKIYTQYTKSPEFNVDNRLIFLHVLYRKRVDRLLIKVQIKYK